MSRNSRETPEDLKNIFPKRTEKAHKVAQKIARIMKELQISGALTVFIHEDKTISIGISGEITEDFRQKVDKLQKKLDAAQKSGELKKCMVSTETIPMDHLNEINDLNACKRGVCSESKAACAAHLNPYKVIEYDVVWCGNSKNPYPLKSKEKMQRKLMGSLTLNRWSSVVHAKLVIRKYIWILLILMIKMGFAEINL